MIIKKVLTASILLISLLSAAQTKEEVYIYLLQIGCDEAEIVTKQSVEECGHHYQSYGARVRHNLFGLWNSKEQRFYRFDNWKDSCIGYMNMIQYKHRKGEDYLKL
jgi:hypothetical protein